MIAIKPTRYLLQIVYICAVTGILLFLLAHRSFDDPYITYRYAANIATGQGFVYNQGERVLSTTAPFYAVILAMGRMVGMDIPLFSHTLGCLSLALGGLAFWYLGEHWNTRLVGITGLLLYPTMPFLLPTLGAEMVPQIGLLLWALVFYTREQYAYAAIGLALATLIRADASLMVVVLMGHFLIVRRQPWPWRAILLYTGLLAPWFLFAWSYFGAPLPVTLAAKQRQGMLTISQSFWDGLIGMGRSYWSMPFYQTHILLLLPGLVYGVLRQRSWLLLIIWNLLYVAAYSLLGVTRYFWYYAPLAVGIVVLIGLSVTLIYHLSKRVIGMQWAGVLAAVILTALLIPQLLSLATFSRGNDSRMAIYRTLGEWLHTHTPPAASVGTLEVGIIGYYAERHMVDFAGLIQPTVAQQLTPESTFDDTMLWAVQHFQPDYLVLHEGSFALLEQDAAIQCHALERFTADDYPGVLMVYGCEW